MTSNVPHLLTYISGHGFGHVAQTAPVLNHLRERLPEMRLTVCSPAPEALLRSRISGPFDIIPRAADFGMRMASALDVLAEASLTDYQDFHRNWPERVRTEAGFIRDLRPNLILTNVAYLPLAASKLAGVPAMSMCSLNWVDILQHYCPGPATAGILEEMRAAYATANPFLRTTPGMPMVDLPNLRPVGPIARLGVNRRNEINARLGPTQDEKLVLISLGGVASRLPMEHWPQATGIRWVVQADWNIERPDTIILETLAMEFTDLLASCDALICKPGYGSFAEAACNGVPVLYVSRADWPEEACLTEWLQAHDRCVEVDRITLESGALAPALHTLWSQSPPPRPLPTGIAEAAGCLLRSISIASP